MIKGWMWVLIGVISFVYIFVKKDFAIGNIILSGAILILGFMNWIDEDKQKNANHDLGEQND